MANKSNNTKKVIKQKNIQNKSEFASKNDISSNEAEILAVPDAAFLLKEQSVEVFNQYSNNVKDLEASTDISEISNNDDFTTYDFTNSDLSNSELLDTSNLNFDDFSSFDVSMMDTVDTNISEYSTYSLYNK